MYSVTNNITPSANQSNIFSDIRTTIRSAELSKGARLTMILLRIACGPRGYVNYRISSLADAVGSSETRVKEYLRELKAAGLIESIERPGHANRWIIKDHPQAAEGGGRKWTPLKKVYRKKTFTGLNAISPQSHAEPPEPEGRQIDVIPAPAPEPVVVLATQPEPVTISENATQPTIEPSKPAPQAIVKPTTVKKSPPRPPRVIRIGTLTADQAELLKEILYTTKDHHSLGAWIRIVKECDAESIRIALSSLRYKVQTESGVNRGRYLIGALRGVCGFTFRSSRPPEPPRTLLRQQIDEPDPPPCDRDEAMSHIARIKQTLSRGIHHAGGL